MPHTKTMLTESELKDYLREHVGIVQSNFMTNEQIAASGGGTLNIEQPKKRGRPKGSRNKPKLPTA